MGHCYNTAVVPASVDQVWARLQNFHDLSWAPGVIDSVQAESDMPGDHVGAKRVLNGEFHETLTCLDKKDHVITYRMDSGPGPLDTDALHHYIGKIHLLPVTDEDSTFVEWSSDFEAASETEVTAFCDPIYQALLISLKDSFSEGY